MEKFRGAGLAICRSLEGFEDKYLLKVLQMRDEVQSFIRERECVAVSVSHRGRVVACYEGGKSFGLDCAGWLKGYGTFNCVLQFANVAWPGITLQQLERFLVDRKIAACLSTELLNEMIHQVGDVFASIAQWR